MDAVGILSEETFSFCSSFDSTSEYNRSAVCKELFHKSKNMIQKTSQNSVDIPVTSPLESNITMNSSKKCLEYKRNNFSYNEDFNTPENLSFFSPIRSEGLLVDEGEFPSVSKIRDLKQVASEVQEAFVLWMISQVVLDSYKASTIKIQPQLATKMKEVVSAPSVMANVCIRSRYGKTYNILGLDNEDLEHVCSKPLTSVEQCELSQIVMPILQTNVEQLSAQRKRLIGLFSTHCQKVMVGDSLITEERAQVAGLQQSAGAGLDQGCYLLGSCGDALQQFSQLVCSSQKNLNDQTFACLLDKARYLYSSTSKLRLKMDQRMNEDVNFVKAMSALGDHFKTSLDKSREELKSLQKALSQYEKKEETSKRFKETVLEYAKIKAQLHHKYQTLNVLNDPDVSFS